MKHPDNSKYKIRPRTNAFTMVELLVALMVSSIVLTAIVTLSYAMSSAYDYSADTNEKEAYIRTTTLRINNLIKYSNLICKVKSDEILIWVNDDNNNQKINISELIYIDKSDDGTNLRLIEFNPLASYDWTLSLSFIQSKNKSWFLYWYKETYTTLISNCSNISIQAIPDPPYSQYVNISFDIEENGQTRKCQISTSLRRPMSSFIDSDGYFINDDLE